MTVKSQSSLSGEDNYSEEVALEIFNAPIPWSSEADKDKCQKEILSHLSNEELEEAACISYAYYRGVHMNTNENNSIFDKINKDEVRTTMALRAARRCLVGDKHNSAVALKRLKETLKYRRDAKVNDLRAPFCSDPEILENKWIEQIAVCGYDTSDRAILVRIAKPFDFTTMSQDLFVRLVVYKLERAIACGEYKSRGQQEKLIVAMDYTQHNRKASPSLPYMKAMIHVFQTYYPERLQLFIAADPPLSIKILTNLIWPFLDPDTRQKVLYVTGPDAKERELQTIVTEENAMPFLRPKGGKLKRWNTPEYLKEIPFHKAANEE